jgi:hypothetical protein
MCGGIFPSVGLAYRVAAVEAIVKTTGVSGSFSEFVRDNVSPNGDLDRVLHYLYARVRSAHFHSGDFPSREFARASMFDPLMDQAMLQRHELHVEGFAVIRESIVDWILRLAPDRDTESEPSTSTST